MRASGGKWPNANSTANMILKKYWPNQMVDQIRNMRTMKDGSGVVFDVYEDKCERFMDVFLHLKDNDSRVDFTVQKCSSLPDLVEEGGDDGYGSNWRGGGNDGGFGSGGGSNYRGGNDRNPSNGYGGGYSKGGYGRQSSDNQGFSNKGRDWRNDGNQDNARTDWKGRDEQQSYDWGSKPKTAVGNYGVASGSGQSSKSSYVYSTPGSTQSTPNPYDSSQGFGRGAPQVQQQKSTDEATVFVKNLSFQTNESQLGDFFKQQKLRVVKAKILLNGQGQSKGLAMVEFQTPSEASYAVKDLNGARCDNREIQIVFANSTR